MTMSIKQAVDTRIVANPHGYSRVEGHAFNPAFVVTVPSGRQGER